MPLDLSTVDALRPFAVLASGLAETADAEHALARIAAAADQHIGHRLLTVLTLDPATLGVRRLYSTNPAAYPPGGSKPMRDTWWGRHVLEQGQPYIGRNADDIRAHFADHEVILGLGLESIMNVPVRARGQTLGTVNLLNTRDYYGDQHLLVGQLLAGLLGSVLLAHPQLR